jgi:hypothetical protein
MYSSFFAGAVNAGTYIVIASLSLYLLWSVRSKGPRDPP